MGNDERVRTTRRSFLRAVSAVSAGVFLRPVAGAAETRGRPNVLFITADDMNDDTPGVCGGKIPEVTPTIDRLASEGMRFTRAHVTCAVCQPSRQTLMTGRYPHRFGALGFEPIDPKVTTLQEILHGAGYATGILGKVGHLAPRSKFPWDLAVDAGDLGIGRDPALYERHARAFFAKARADGKPFFLMANSHDPHRPFSGSAAERNAFRGRLDRVPKPSRTYAPAEVAVPGFLPDIPDVRREVAEYASSARRCDDTVAAVLRALRESGLEGETLVMFLSDNGMAFPFAKTNCYLHSTRTPWIVRWPGRVKPGALDETHFISGIDFLPTILEAAGLAAPEGIDGRSFLPLLSGRAQAGRDRVYTVFYKTSADVAYPMRCVQDGRFGYIFNAWADGKTRFRNESQSGLTMRAMQKAGESDPGIAGRVRLFLYRVPEELYDFSADPDALRNLAGHPPFRDDLARRRADLLGWMERTGDPILPAFRRHLETISAAKPG
ncbi:MAG: sulfatase [Planctomycetes bacterium]|nr:sulfatase [Planctomycetota bacterium]